MRRDPRVCIVVTSTGAHGVPNRRTVTYKGICTLHTDDDTKAWFYPELAAALHPDPDRSRHFARFLDSPNRVILEVEPTQRIAFDGTKPVTPPRQPGQEAARATEGMARPADSTGPPGLAGRETTEGRGRRGAAPDRFRQTIRRRPPGSPARTERHR